MARPLLDTVETFTRLAGHNRVAMLLFRLGDGQAFGINVFKVREVLRRPRLERMPSMHELVAGSFDYRGSTIPVVDLAAAMGYPPLATEDGAHLIVTEFNRSVQGFLVSDVDRIVHVDGGNLAAPPPALGYGPRVNAVTRLDGNLMAVVDVEQVLASVDPRVAELSERVQQAAHVQQASNRRVLVVDDSLVARTQLVDLFRKMDLECVVAKDGSEGFDMLRNLAAGPASERIALVVSDIEMPAMDGYALTRAIREDTQLRHLKVLLHSSLSGVFNEAMVERVGADRFIAKFQPDVLATAVLELLPA
ncbi:two-component system chemotaxis response regulator CheV [Luteibacter jiangsuensis]|uniref:Two-component system chemotaxis response regulator CheV n=1 Tax=Luteibacter jiangsuensis TaxID=637577 RepID=A0ABT9T237_9GAMM|nr:chemotaxis protein [Luteibacter jiangsuensis]MDQ0011341.1 two-component system chemotaxis response regulator CheV [Luteibacter jiangsuensis]